MGVWLSKCYELLLLVCLIPAPFNSNDLESILTGVQMLTAPFNSNDLESILTGVQMLTCVILLKTNRKAGNKPMELVNSSRHFQCLALEFKLH